jgi:hypothetical protein
VPDARIHELTIADQPATWAAVGFAVEDDVCRVGGVPIRLAGPSAKGGLGPGAGLVGWSLSGIASEQLDGLPTTLANDASVMPAPSAASAAPLPAGDATREAAGDAPPHPNGVTALDHVVAVTPALDRTVAALQSARLDLRRVREEPTPAGAPRQAFFRLGEVILEVVQAPGDAIERSGGSDGPAFFWGLAFKAADLDATVAMLGEERCSPPRPAVQPGRRIATLRRSAGLALPVALMTE